MGYSFPLQCALFWHILFIYFSVGSVALQTYWHSEWCWITFTFTFMHLADAFIQSDLHCIQVTVFHLTRIIQEAKRWSHLLCFFYLCLLFFSSLSFSHRRTITGCLPSMQKLKILSIDFALKQRLASQTVFMVLCFFPFIWRLTWIQCHTLPRISRPVSFLRVLWCRRELFLDSSGWVNTI